jgi:hypothetical protein
MGKFEKDFQKCWLYFLLYLLVIEKSFRRIVGSSEMGRAPLRKVGTFGSDIGLNHILRQLFFFSDVGGQR